MAKAHQLRAMLELQLTTTHKEIFELFDEMVADYEGIIAGCKEEIHRLQEENKEGKLLDAVFNPHVCLYRADTRQLLVSKDVLLEQQEELNLDQNDLEAPDVKEEQEELWSEDEENPQFSQILRPREQSTEVELLSSNTTDHKTLKLETHRDDYGGSEPARTSGPCGHSQPHTDDKQKLLLNKEENFPEPQEWNLTIDQEDIKEEQVKLWISQQGQQLYLQEESEITVFPFTAFPVKSENIDENTHSLHVIQSDESREVEPVASSTSVHRTLTVQDDGGDDGETPTASSTRPNSSLQPDTSGGRLDGYEKDSHDWNDTGDPNSSFKSQETFSVSNITKTDLNFFEHDEGCHVEYSELYTRMQGSENPFRVKPFACSMCGRRFSLKGNLVKHMRVHMGEKPFGCFECGAKFNLKGNLMRHITIHMRGKPFECPTCGANFKRKDNLIAHMRIHTGEKPFECSECVKTFGQKGDLMRHMKIHAGHRPFGCCECGKRFGLKGNLKKHMMIHMEQKPFSCSVCSKPFRQKSNLVAHMVVHTGEKAFHCFDCGKRFGHKGDLKKHLQIHSGQKPFGCFDCGKKFGRKAHLTTHIRIHTGEKPFHCSVCGVRFTLKGNLIKHMTIHTGEKPFDCSECGAKFRQKCNLIAHMVVHTGDKPFSCSVCGKLFGQKGSVITHMKIHTGEKPYDCSVCGVRFALKGNLIKHFRIHTGEKPFDCSECGAKFRQKSNLIAHMVVHTGEKPFRCSLCSKPFGQKANLLKHMRVHPEDPSRNTY